jgi:hypothetical protein
MGAPRSGEGVAKMRGFKAMMGAGALALAMAAAPAAAVVTYTFEGLSAFGNGNFGRFQINLPGPVTATTVFPAAQFTSCEVLSNPDLSCGDHGFTFATVGGFGIDADMIEFAVRGDNGFGEIIELSRTFYYFAPGAFGANGTYETIIFGQDQAAVLEVSGIRGGGGGGPAVPEPASWAMLIAGFGLVGALQRRRPALAA